MSLRIYRSAIPDITNLPACSAFTYAFPPATRDPYPPTAPAFIDGPTGRTLTRADVRRLALALGHGLTHALPVPLARGSTVLLFAPNALAYPLALFGALAAGFTVSLANPAYTASELHHQFHNSGAAVALVHPTLVPIALDVLTRVGYSADEARARCVVLDYAGLSGVPAPKGHATLDGLLTHGTLVEEARFDGRDADETAFLCYSSGTTGRAKGVMVCPPLFQSGDKKG